MAGIGSQDGAEDVSRRRREFIRAHHPDRGGDVEAFIAGLGAFDADQAPGDPPPRVTIVPHRPWLLRLAAASVRRLRHDGRPPRVR